MWINTSRPLLNNRDIREGLQHASNWEQVIKQVFYGIVLLVVVMFLPHGIWPSVARKLGLAREEAGEKSGQKTGHGGKP